LPAPEIPPLAGEGEAAVVGVVPRVELRLGRIGLVGDAPAGPQINLKTGLTSLHRTLSEMGALRSQSGA